MMIHFPYTSSAILAMKRSLGFDDQTKSTNILLNRQGFEIEAIQIPEFI